MNRTKPSSGSIVIENGQVKKENSSMKVGDYTVIYNATNKTFVASEGSKVEILCKANIEKVNSLVWNRNASPYEVTSYTSEEVGLLASESGAYTLGVTYTCELGDGEEKTFYVLEESGDNVSLLMNMNVDSSGKGTTEGINVEKTMILEYLKSSTKSWSNLKESQISLPSAEQLAVANGKSFDGKNIVRNLLNWLYVENSTAPSGYWTSTSVGSSRNWSVDGIDGIISDGSEGLCNYIGVRPVITLSKSQLG